MNAAQKIIEQMPEKFTRQDVLKCAKELGYSYSTAIGVLDQVQGGSLSRITKEEK